MHKLMLKLKKMNKRAWLCLFFAILLTLSGLFFWGADQYNNQGVSLEIEDLSTNIRRHYQNKPDFWGLSTQTVLDKKICPNKMLQNGKLVGFFDNPVLVGNGPNAMVLMPGARNFDIIYKDLDKKQCVAVATSKLKQDIWLGVVGVSIVNKDKQQRFDWDNKEYSLPIKTTQAKKSCGNDSMVIWHLEQ